MNLQSWTLPPDVQSHARRSEFDRCKAESDLGFDVGVATMHPADVLRVLIERKKNLLQAKLRLQSWMTGEGATCIAAQTFGKGGKGFCCGKA